MKIDKAVELLIKGDKKIRRKCWPVDCFLQLSKNKDVIYNAAPTDYFKFPYTYRYFFNIEDIIAKDWETMR